MKQAEKFSDEFLNAFIDGQLDEAERSDLLEELRNNDALSRRVCQLRKVRDMVQLAYLDTPDPAQHTPEPVVASRGNRFAAAAAILLLVGSVSGWVLHSSFSKPRLTELAELVQAGERVNNSKEWQLVLHITTDDSYRLKTALDETEALLKTNRDKGKLVKVELLTNGKGLKLLRADASPYASRIHELQQHYQSLSFLACGKTIQRLKKEQGIDVVLLPETEVVSSALSQIMKRKQDGWTYIRI